MVLKGRFWAGSLKLTHKDWLCPLQKFKGSLVLHTQLGGGDVTILGFQDPVISVAVGWNDTSETLEGLQEAQWEQGSGVRVKRWWWSPHLTLSHTKVEQHLWNGGSQCQDGMGLFLQCSRSPAVLLTHFWQWEMPDTLQKHEKAQQLQRRLLPVLCKFLPTSFTFLFFTFPS